jgi:biotin synthase
MGMEVCTTLGMLDAVQAQQLKEAGLTAYNHNLDTSREVCLLPTSLRTHVVTDIW